MKPRFPFATSLVVAAQAIALAQASAASPIDASQTIFLDADSPEYAEFVALGDRAIARVGYSMVSEAASTVARAGALGALDECHLKKLPTSGAIVPGMPRITAVKRTSLRLRDPANAPDPADQLALDRIRTALEAGDSPPKLLLQRVWLRDGAAEWRLYRPIAVAPQCVACHGPKADMPPDFLAELARRYPADQAIDCAPGSWRGLIRVSIGDPPKGK